MSNTNKYNNTIIYKIYCIDCDYSYVGHTTDFEPRKRSHKDSCNNENSEKYNLKLYEVIRKYGGWTNWIMEKLETCNCNDFKDALEREEYWYNQLKPTLNSVKPNFDKKQYNKEYSQLLHAKVSKSRRDKEYRERNRDEVLKKKKEWYEKNKEKLNEKNKEKIICECGSEVTICNLRRHKKSKKHLDFINII